MLTTPLAEVHANTDGWPGRNSGYLRVWRGIPRAAA